MSTIDTHGLKMHIIRIARMIKLLRDPKNTADMVRAKLLISVADRELYCVLIFIDDHFDKTTTAYRLLEEYRLEVLGPLYQDRRTEMRQTLAKPEIREYITTWGLDNVESLVDLMLYLGFC